MSRCVQSKVDTMLMLFSRGGMIDVMGGKGVKFDD